MIVNRILVLLLSVLLFASCKTSKRGNKTNVRKSDKTKQVEQVSNRLIGSPYKYAGTSTSGFDCSGFTQYVFEKVQVEIPRTSEAQSRTGTLIKISQAKPGDLVFFRKGKTGKKINHVGIVQQANQQELRVVHSTSSKGVISENIYDSSYWKSRILFCRRVL